MADSGHDKKNLEEICLDYLKREKQILLEGEAAGKQLEQLLLEAGVTLADEPDASTPGTSDPVFPLSLYFHDFGLETCLSFLTQHDELSSLSLDWADCPGLGELLLNREGLAPEVQAREMARLLREVTSEGPWEVSLQWEVQEFSTGLDDVFEDFQRFVARGGVQLGGPDRCRVEGLIDEDFPYLRFVATYLSSSSHDALRRYREDLEAIFGALLADDRVYLDNTYSDRLSIPYSDHIDDLPKGERDGKVLVSSVRRREFGHVRRWVLGGLAEEAVCALRFHDLVGDSKMEWKRFSRDERHSFLGTRLTQATSFFRLGRTDRERMRIGCRLFLRAFFARDPGEVAIFGATVLESLLLDGKDSQNTTARLKEATAHRLGRNPAERAEIRRAVAKLYDVRSRYIHTGQVSWPVAQQKAALKLIGLVLREEIRSGGDVSSSSAGDEGGP